MKNISLLGSLCITALVLTGCQGQQSTQDPPSALTELRTQGVRDVEKEEKPQVVATPTPASGIAIYRGSWFDISYPRDFTATPPMPNNSDIPDTRVETDEAYFVSPDGSTEFFVFSPLWGGNPKNYLDVAPNEEVVSEEFEEVKDTENPKVVGDKMVRWLTVKATDSSYHRSLVSVKNQIGTGSETHHVFGIKYRDDNAYAKYRNAYIAFKNSLQQYAD